MKLPWPEVKIPEYYPGQHGKWTLARTFGCMPGYFSPDLHNCDVPALRRREHSKDIVWMSLAWMERESHMPHIAAAYGHTVVMGLGMGMYLYNIIQKPEVTRVTVIERDKSVFNLLRKISDYDKWPGIEKVHAIFDDAKTWRAKEKVDFLYADFWKNMGEPKAMVWTHQALQNVKPEMFGYWTQEFDFVDYMRDRKININQASVELYNEFAASFGHQRMVGQGDEAYAILCCMAVLIQISVSLQIKKEFAAATILKMQFEAFQNKYTQIMKGTHNADHQASSY